MFDTEKCCVEIEFKACFRGFLRCSRYSSCGYDKLSEAGKFYLRGCKVAALRFLCVGVCRIARRFEFCAAFGVLVALYASLCIRRALSVSRRRARASASCCALRQSVHSFTCRIRCRRLKFCVRRPAHRSTLSLDIRVFRALRVRSSVRKLGLAPSTCVALRLLPSVRHAASYVRR